MSRAVPQAPPSGLRRVLTGGVALWVGTVAYGGSTVALLAVLSHRTGHTGFSGLAALLSLAFVMSLIPAGVQLRSAALVADGRPPPALRLDQAFVLSGGLLVLSPVIALLMHVAVSATVLVMIQLTIAVPLAARQGALLAQRRFNALGLNLVLEGLYRFALGAALGKLWGVTGLAAGICLGTACALLVIPGGLPDAGRQDRPRTSLVDTSLSLALLGLYVQLDIMLAPSVLSGGGATTYDLAAVPSKAVYLALLAAGPVVFPYVRRGGEAGLQRALVTKSVAGGLGVGLVATLALLFGRPLIAAVLGRAEPDLVQLALLGSAMALAGVTGIVINAGVARGVRRPWPPLVLGIATLAACAVVRPTPLSFACIVLASHGVTCVGSLAFCLGRRPRAESSVTVLDELVALSEAGDAVAPAVAMTALAAPHAEAPHALAEAPHALAEAPHALAEAPHALAEAPHALAEAPHVQRATVAVVIPTFRRAVLLGRLIESLHAGSRVPDEIIVVDNDPAGSVDEAELPSAVRLLRGGFGINASAARNLGWRQAGSDVCVFIDDDNEVEVGCVEALANACLEPTVGLAGPVIHSGHDGTVWCAGLRFSRWTGITRCVGKGSREVPREGTWSTDGMPDAYALRREVLVRLGGLDDHTFPLCGEELDLARRIGQLGLKTVVVGQARVRHYGNVSEDPGAWLVSSALQHGRERPHLMARSRVRVHRRYSHGPARFSTLGLFVPLWALASCLACLRVRAPLWARLTAVGALVTGVLEGYRERLEPRRPAELQHR